MAFGGYVYQGFQDRSDELDNQRMKTAKAFEEFKKANPYATTQELRDAVDQFAGSSPYLRSGAATEETIKDIARRNAQARYAYERQQYQDNNKAKKQSKQDMQDNLFGYYTETGDMQTALNRLKSDLDALNPQTDYQSDQLEDDKRYLDGLDLNAVASQFDQRYFNENKDLITSQISAGTSFDEFARNSANPHMVNSGTFSNLYKNLFEDEVETRRITAFERLNKLLSDPNYMNQVGAGNLDSIRQAMGERFSRFLDDGEIEQRLRSQQDLQFQTKASAARVKALEYANNLQTKNSDDLGSYLSAVGKDLEDVNAMIALQAFSNTHNYSNHAVLQALVQEIDAEGNDISPAKMNEILNRYKGNGFVDNNSYVQMLQNQYMETQGLNKKTYLTDYVGDAFGDGVNDQGKIGEQVKLNAKRVKDVTQDTATVTGFKGNQWQSRLSSTNYQSHITDIKRNIEELSQQRQQIIDIVARSENPGNFYGTINEDYGQNVTLARNQGQRHLETVDGQIAELQEKLAQVQVEAESVARRDQGIATQKDFAPGSANMLQLQQYFENKGYADIVRNGGTLTQTQIDDIMRNAGVDKLPSRAMAQVAGNPGSKYRKSTRNNSQQPMNALYPNMSRQGPTKEDQMDYLMKALGII